MVLDVVTAAQCVLVLAVSPSTRRGRGGMRLVLADWAASRGRGAAGRVTDSLWSRSAALQHKQPCSRSANMQSSWLQWYINIVVVAWRYA